MKNEIPYFPNLRSFFTRFTPLYWLAVSVALFLWSRDWVFVQATSTELEHLFGLFGFCVFCVIVYFFYISYSRTAASLKNGVFRALPFLVSLFFLAIVVELGRKSWDYEQYEAAFRALVDHENPYLSTRYLYPPFFAQFMVSVYQVGTRLFPLLGLASKGSDLWIFVFYIHQSASFYALLLAYVLSLHFAARVGLTRRKSMLLVSAIFLLNVPLFRTLSYNQVNFYILASLLAAMLALRRAPVLSGLAAAVGGLLKLYPLALALPWLVTRKWKALLGMAIGVTGILFLQTAGFRDLTVWKQFILFYRSFPVERESSWFRNTSPMSLLRNLVDFSGLPSTLLAPIFVLAILAVLVWYGVRLVQRERVYRRMKSQPDLSATDADTFRDFGHMVDFSVLSLLIAPSAWEHHYLIAVPLVIWAFALRATDALGRLLLGWVLVFLLPVFNIFPFSYLRMLGLIILLVLVSPKQIEDQMAGNLTVQKNENSL